MAEDSAGDELFDLLAGHVWDQVVLMFKILWKMGNMNMQPFSMVKVDYPRETATYILQHKLESAGDRTTSARYIRWAWKFTGQLTRVLRQLLRDSSGWIRRESMLFERLRVCSHLPNGRSIVRRAAIQAVQKKGEGRKRTKPG